MARHLPGIVNRLLARQLDQLIGAERLRLSLVTELGLERVELVTDPPGEYVVHVTESMRECQFRDLPRCVVTYIDFIDGGGVVFYRESYGFAVPAGGTLTVPVFVSPS